MEKEEEKMRKYIYRTPISDEKFKRCQLRRKEMCIIYDAIMSDIWEGLFFSFEYGMARGYRAAKAEARK